MVGVGRDLCGSSSPNLPFEETIKYLEYDPKSQGQERCHGWSQDSETPQIPLSCFIPDLVEAEAKINF